MDGPSQSQHSNSRTQICPVFQARVASSGVEGRQLVLCLCVTQVNNDYIITKRPFGDGFWSSKSWGFENANLPCFSSTSCLLRIVGLGWLRGTLFVVVGAASVRWRQVFLSVSLYLSRGSAEQIGRADRSKCRIGRCRRHCIVVRCSQISVSNVYAASVHSTSHLLELYLAFWYWYLPQERYWGGCRSISINRYIFWPCTEKEQICGFRKETENQVGNGINCHWSWLVLDSPRLFGRRKRCYEIASQHAGTASFTFLSIYPDMNGKGRKEPRWRKCHWKRAGFALDGVSTQGMGAIQYTKKISFKSSQIHFFWHQKNQQPRFLKIENEDRVSRRGRPSQTL